MTDGVILLVEDNAGDEELALRALRRCELTYEIKVARDGVEALDYIFAGPNPALVLLDLKLPKIDGIEVLRRLRADARTRRIPIVMLTSSNEDRDVRSCYDLGVNSFIRKPFEFSEFVDAVRQVAAYWLKLNEQPPR
jgi:two-component system response regulator